MITKKYSKDRTKCDVTFQLPAEINSSQAFVCGNFSDWTPEEMKRLKKGGFSIRKKLKAKQNYQFRYRLDGERWENDPAADALIPNAFGSDDSVLQL
jgi:1,4-alpha-glucan branching enzyme